MNISILSCQAVLAGLCATGLVAAPKDHQATIGNRSSDKWELRLDAQGHGTLRVTLRSKKGTPFTLDYPAGEAWVIELDPGDELTLSFLEAKDHRTRPATLGVVGALDGQASGLYLQDGPAGIVLAATAHRQVRQNGNHLEIRNRPDDACAIL